MSIEVNNESGHAVDEAEFAALARYVLDAMHVHPQTDLSILLVGTEVMTELHVEWMDEPGPTDVLSFPLFDPAFPLPPGRRPHLGDIVVSVERATEQAIEGRGGQTSDVAWSPADEMRLLVTHGALHICGWDHAEPEEEVAMRVLERRLLGTDTRS